MAVAPFFEKTVPFGVDLHNRTQGTRQELKANKNLY
jgi:hypothetical protein